MRIQATVMEKPDGTLTRRKITIETVEIEPPRADEVLVTLPT